MMSLRDQIANACKHFNGIQHAKCNAGVAYEEVETKDKPILLPCFKSDAFAKGRPVPECPSRCSLTDEEVEAELQAVHAVLEKARESYRSGKCSECGADVEPTKTIGLCVYAACGHRIGQGCSEDDLELGRL